MSATGQKGLKGEHELKDYLNDLFEPFGFRWERMGGIEASKFGQSITGAVGGDVGLVGKDWRTGKKYRDPEECILNDVLWDAKWHNTAKPVAWVKKVNRDATTWMKGYGFVYAIVGKNKKRRTILMENNAVLGYFMNAIKPYKVFKGIAYIDTEEFKKIIELQK